jgi:hypothetical protein
MVDIFLKVPNWREFQHYKNRRPPWIKLHRTLLDNYDYHQLPLASRALAPCLWLIASDDENGVIQCASEALAFRLRVTEGDLLEALKHLIDRGFFVDASMLLASCDQHAMPETEREGETEERPFQGRMLVTSKSRGDVPWN